MPGKGYVVGDSSGWLRVKSEGSGIIVALPAYLKIDIGEIKNGREPFTVQEGVHAGKRFDAVPGNLKAGNPGYRGSAQLRFMIGRGELHYPGGVARARTDPKPDSLCGLSNPDPGLCARVGTGLYQLVSIRNDVDVSGPRCRGGGKE
jgi:hypothetical protein